MKKIVIALMTAAVAGLAAPALAHDDDDYGRGGYSDWDRDGGYSQLGAMFQHDMDGIRHGLSDGAYTRREARWFYRQLNDIRGRAAWYYRRDGMSPWERQDIAARLDDLHERMHDAHEEGHELQDLGLR